MATPELPKGVPLTRALGALAVTPLVGSVILALMFVLPVGTAFPAVLLYIVQFAYAAAAVFVLPVLVVWPASRRPTYLVAAVWGALAASGGWLFLASRQVGFPRVYVTMSSFTGVGLFWGGPGAVSGVFYAWLVRRPDGK